jgi:hypothetical protein
MAASGEEAFKVEEGVRGVGARSTGAVGEGAGAKVETAGLLSVATFSDFVAVQLELSPPS